MLSFASKIVASITLAKFTASKALDDGSNLKAAASADLEASELYWDSESEHRNLQTTRCPDGQYSSQGICKNCATGCKLCSGSVDGSKCFRCFDSLMTLKNNACTCDSPLTISTDGATCCPKYCTSCTSNSALTRGVCDTCANKF